MSERGQAAEQVALALRDDPFYRSLVVHLSGDDARHAALVDYLHYSLEEGLQLGRAVVGKAGAAIWSLPQDAATEREAKARKTHYLRQRLGEPGLAAYLEMVAAMDEQLPDFPDDEVWYLSILGVDPEQQGGGHGKSLLRPTLDEADARGAGSYLETFGPASEPFYRALGYQRIKVGREPVTDSDYAIYYRPPNAAT